MTAKRLAFVRSLPCASCGRHPPSEAHHPTGAGLALKADDAEAFPLCSRCHRDFHDLRGKFRDWDKAARRLWQRTMSALYRAEEPQKSQAHGDHNGDVDPGGEVF